jgi:ABC-type sugar transport system substrate-binding protein
MKKLKFVVSLTTQDNDYQVEQAVAAEAAARRCNVDIQIIYAENDSILQSQQLLKSIQSSPESRPDGIIFEPVGGTAMPQVARASAAAGIAWVVLNREVDYLSELRRNRSAPAFAISSDHEEIGRIQGRQIAALLPNGGSVLLIQGPAENPAAKQRTLGMYETKPVAVHVKLMKGNWTEASGHKAVSSWLKLSTSQQTTLDVVAAQDDSMVLGARKAFQEVSDGAARERWMAMPFLGIDGMAKTGQAWVKRGLLAATIIVPTNSDQAVEMLAQSLQSGTMPPEKVLTGAKSFPPAEDLARKGGRAAAAHP